MTIQKHFACCFLYNHKRHNEVNLNLMQTKVDYAPPGKLTLLALMSRHIPQYNLASEPQMLRLICKQTLGETFHAHEHLTVRNYAFFIGFEKCCWVCWLLLDSERSMVMKTLIFWNSIRITSTNRKRKLLSLFFTNGWQRDERRLTGKLIIMFGLANYNQT